MLPLIKFRLWISGRKSWKSDATPFPSNVIRWSMILNCPFAGYVHFFPCLVCVCVCVWCSNPHKSMKIGLTQRQAEQVRAQEYLLVCIWLAKKIHSDFLLHCVEKPKQTFGPTLYLLCPLLQTALHCSASPLEGTVVMAMKADLQRWVYKNETYIKGKKRDETLLWTNNRIP